MKKEEDLGNIRIPAKVPYYSVRASRKASMMDAVMGKNANVHKKFASRHEMT